MLHARKEDFPTIRGCRRLGFPDWLSATAALRSPECLRVPNAEMGDLCKVIGVFEKMRFRQSVEISQQVYQMMDEGKKIFPNEGVTELHDYIERIKHSVTFSMDELHEVYEDDGVKKALFPTFDTLKTALIGYANFRWHDQYSE